MLVLIGLILLGYLAYRLIRNHRPGPHPDETGSSPAAGSGSARQILDERYARGKIDEQDYRRRRSELQGPPRRSTAAARWRWVGSAWPASPPARPTADPARAMGCSPPTPASSWPSLGWLEPPRV